MTYQQPKLVNKQFNSPIGLYSDKNVREVLDRESQLLANGAVGINFHNPMSNKPANLHNSAVLRMLEEEESKQRNGQAPGYINQCKPLREWPPPGVNNRQRQYKDIVVSGVKRVAWPPPQGEDEEYSEETPVQAQGGVQFSAQAPGLQNSQSPNNFQQVAPVTNNYQPRPVTPVPALQRAPQSPVINNYQRPITPVQRAPQSPVFNNYQQPRPVTPVQRAPQSPVVYNIPIAVSPAYIPAPGNYAPATVVAKPWAPVQSPVSPQPTNQKPAFQPYQPPQQYQAPQQQYQPPQQQYQAPQQQYQPPQQQYQAPQQQYQPPQQQYQAPQQYQPPQQQYQGPPQQLPQSTQQFQSPQQYQSPQQQPQSPQPQQRSPQPQNQVAAVPEQQQYKQTAPIQVKKVEPPPSIITLRPKTPISQAPAPVFTSQPATATLKGGKNLRGDMKWPPETVKDRMEAENQMLVDLARGPACRPRRVDKDYSPFFAQHALNSTYPGYKIPPGTQFYDHHPMM